MMRVRPKAHRIVSACLLALLMVCSAQRIMADTAPLATLPETNGTVNAMLLAKGILYIGGSFTQITFAGVNVMRDGLAAIDIDNGTVVNDWNPKVGGAAVHALALSSDGNMLIVGGEFTRVGDITRNHLAAIGILRDSATYNLASDWDPDVSGNAVYSIVMSANGDTVYIGGDFSAVGGAARSHIAAVEYPSGVTTPWAPQSDGFIYSLLLSDDGTILYAGGAFNIIGGVGHPGLAALSVTSGAGMAWKPAPDAAVRTMVQSGATLYIGGDFTQLNGGTVARNHLAAIATTDASVSSAWNPDADAVVRSLVLSADASRLYVGGDFSMMGGSVRNHLASLSVADASLNGWNPLADNSVKVQIYDPQGSRLIAGGSFTSIGTTAVSGLVGFSVAPPVTTATPTGGEFTAAAAPTSVVLSCTADGASNSCMTFYTIDGTTPSSSSMLYSAPIALPANTDVSLKYFSLDAEGVTESVRTGLYIVDDAPPQTTAVPAGGVLNQQDSASVVLECSDVDVVPASLAAGCDKTFFTTDGSTPTTAATEYTGPITLTADTTLKFFSTDKAGNDEAVVEQIYSVDLIPPEFSVSLPSGAYIAPLTITLSCDDGATGTGCAEISITTDGSPPETDPVPEIYSGPIDIVLTSGTILRVQGFDVAGNSNTALLGVYSFNGAQPEQRSGVGAVSVWALLLITFCLGCRLRQARVG